MIERMRAHVVYVSPPCIPRHPLLCVSTQVVLPPMVPPSLGFFRADGAYLINNGHTMVLWLGRDLSAGWITQVRSAAAPVSTSSRQRRRH